MAHKLQPPGTEGSPREGPPHETSRGPRPGAGHDSATADPRSVPGERSRSSAPRSLADWIPRVLHEMGLDSIHDGARLLSAWQQAVGPELAAHSRPQGVRRGVVYATVPDSAWMQRVQMDKVRILSQLREALGPEQARDLRLRISPTP